MWSRYKLSPYVQHARDRSCLIAASFLVFFESVEEYVDGDIYSHGLCTGVGTRPGTRLGAFVDHQPPTMTSRRTLPGEVAAPRILAAPPSMVAKVFWSTSGCTNSLYRSIAHLFCSMLSPNTQEHSVHTPSTIYSCSSGVLLSALHLYCRVMLDSPTNVLKWPPRIRGERGLLPPRL